MNTSSRKKSRRWLIVAAAVLVLIPGGYFGVRKVAVPVYRDWRSARLDRLAQQFLAAGDYDKALLTVRNNLRDNQRDLTGWRLGASIAKMMKSADAIYYLDHIAQVEKTLPARLEAARVALQYGYPGHAITTLTAAGAAANDDAEFHRLAAEAYQRNGQSAEAKNHLAALVRLLPSDHVAQLDLAEFGLRDAPERANPAWKAHIREAAAADAALRPRAVSLLLADAVMRNATAEAATLADELLACQPQVPAQRILVLRGLTLGAPGRADAYRARLEKEFADDASNAAALLEFYGQTVQYSQAMRWHASLGEKIRPTPAVMQAMADVWISQRVWPTLTRTLATANWGAKDYVRHADLAYAARATGLAAEASDEWKLAVMQAGGSVRNASDLLTRVMTWGWKEERYDVLWKMFALMPRSPAVREPLIAWERLQGNTSNLNRLFARILEVEPDNREMKNNFAYTSLLLGANLGRASQIAKENFAAEPKNPHFASVQALALYKQGKASEALALADSLSAAARSEPERCLHRAVYNAAVGNAEAAADLLAGLPSRRFLPEELKLQTQAAATVAQLEKTKALSTRFASHRTNPAAHAGNGWLQLLPDLRAAATPAMLQADDLYAAADFNALQRALGEASWSGADHIRLSLLAYARRNAGSEAGARDSWRAAVGNAARERAKLRQLAELAGAWQWRAERVEALGRFFEREPKDRALLAELMSYHRAAGHTSDLARVMAVYVAANPSDSAAVGEGAYYSMLSDSNLSAAYVAAKNSYDAAPADAARQLVYAFSLWKQKRAAEAWPLLEKNTVAFGSIVPSSLLRSALLADLGRTADAKREMETYNPEHALPEEAKLASALRGKLAKVAELSSLE